MSLLAQFRGAALGDRAVIIGAAASLAWLLLTALFWLLGPDAPAQGSGLMRLASVVSVIMPLALIWLAVGLARTIDNLRQEANDLRVQMVHMQGSDASADDSTLPEAHFRQGPAPVSAPLARQSTKTAGNPPAKPKAHAPLPKARDPRPSAARADAPASVPVELEDLVLAANFPNGPDDHETIDALRAALRDHDAARVLRAGQDMITLLAGASIYMDHLQPEVPDLSLWRRFAAGERGAHMSQIGTIADDEVVQTVVDLLKSDVIFQDAAHHFLRYFDLAVTRWAPSMSDAQLDQFADSRSARAFLLLGQAKGIFG